MTSLNTAESHTARRGVGILLVLVVTLALILFIAGISQLFFSSQVYRQTARGSGGLVAEYLAKSAVDEMYYKIQRGACDPTDPLFKRLREILQTGEEGPEFEGLVDVSSFVKKTELLTRQIDRSENTSFYRLFTLEDLTALVGMDRTRPELANLVLKLGATAKLTIGPRTVTRRFEETRQLGIMLVAPKRPLDQVTFLVLTNPFLMQFAQLSEKVGEAARLYQSIANWLPIWKSQVEGKPSGVSQTITAQVPGGASPRTIQLNLTEESYAFDGLWPPLGGDSSQLKGIPKDGYLVSTGDEMVHLAAWDHEITLQQALEPDLVRIGEAAAQVDRALETLVSASGRPFTAAEHQAWALQMASAGRALKPLLDNLVKEFARVSNELAPHVRPLPELAGFSLEAQGRMGPKLYPVAYHIQTQKEFDDLIAAHPRLNAHVAYQGKEMLKVDKVGLRGKMIISSEKAPIEIGNVLVGSKEKDLVVIAASEVVFKGGTIEAGVLVRRKAKFKGAPVIRGSLIFEYLPPKKERSLDEELKGTVNYNPRLYSGLLKAKKEAKEIRWSHYTLGFSPVPEEAEILWKE